MHNISIYRNISKRFNKIKDKKKQEKLKVVKDTLFEFDFVNKVNEQIRLIKPVCMLILKSQGKKMSMGEFVGEALKLPSQYEDFTTNRFLRENVETRHELLLTPLTLCTYALLPSTDFYSLSYSVQIAVDG